MRLRIASGVAEVVAHGTVTQFFGEPLLFTLELDGHQSTVTMTFSTDPGQPDVAVDSRFEGDGIVIACVNFDSADGRGSSLPVLIDKIGGDAILFHFRVFRWGRTPDRTVHYAFYRAPPASPPG